MPYPTPKDKEMCIGIHLLVPKEKEYSRAQQYLGKL
jgi:hypothetical protein